MNKFTRRSGKLAVLSLAALLFSVSVPAFSFAAPEVNVQSYYSDSVNGSVLYNINYTEGQQYAGQILEKRQDGQYVKWQKELKEIHLDSEGRYRVYSFDPEFPYGAYVYDPSSRTVLHGSVYNLSPDGKWGIVERFEYKRSQYGISKINDYYIKNMETGSINLFTSSSISAVPQWTGEHRLIMRGYNVAHKQNEIVAYDSEQGITTSLTLGSLYAVNADKGLLLFAKNEPLRKLWIYDLSNGETRLAKNDQEVNDLFYSVTNPEVERPELKLPDDFDIAAVPETKIPVQSIYEHTVTIDGHSIPVPYAFYRNGTLWIPLRPLSKALDWKIRSTKSASSFSYLYSVTVGTSGIRLTPDNSFIADDTMFITEKQIQSLGYTDISVMTKK
ncbi:hypothetical protein [Paenibacillus caui]|uniref:hypothetical protein n=1 Tax=Paenibacillus caui TaxID=2873927 RepID=UPI001CA94DFF|nr:hypothetical protein [Paenibacillus caui]